ncbi:Lrp/AsnC family transcriptional regulator [Novosphingobium terrae]|uniref:Lrp/AsnC family transcriptional regulator n=1 Tax=Novosphingobium terrae TaxID=2726189 RepID=UPI00197F1658|nr:Lrp/AsnC family transcriptional regulator [Novosphingobium terrae]
MDRFDRAILAELEQDSRQSFGAVAEKVGLSKTPCWNRVQALEQQGIITGYPAAIDPYAIGLKLSAFVEVSVEFAQHPAFEAAIMDHPAVLNCYTTAGDGDYLLHVVTSDVEALDGLLRGNLSRLPGVQRFATTICMKTIKRGAPLMAAARLGEP